MDYKILDVAKMKCHYSYTLQQDSLDSNSVIVTDMVLFVGDKKATIFKEYSGFLLDSIIAVKKQYPPNDYMINLIERFGVGSGLSRFSIIKDLSNSKNILLIGFPGNSFRIEEELNLIKWDLKSEERLIHNYKCKKATCHFAGRDYVAWYTMEVPMSEGSYKFSGLPGLIVQIADTKGEHRFELTKLEEINDENSLILYNEKRKYIDVSLEDFLKAYHTYNNGGMNALEQRGISMENTNETKVRKRMKSRNNFIEKVE